MFILNIFLLWNYANFNEDQKFFNSNVLKVKQLFKQKNSFVLKANRFPKWTLKTEKDRFEKNPKMMPIPYWDIFLGFDVKVCLSIILMLHFQTDNYILTSWSARRCQWIKKNRNVKKIIRFLEKILIFEEKNVDFFNLYFPQSTTWVPSKNVSQYGPAVWLAIANIYIWVNSLII